VDPYASLYIDIKGFPLFLVAMFVRVRVLFTIVYGETRVAGSREGVGGSDEWREIKGRGVRGRMRRIVIVPGGS
jgi:hypothetical protein